MNTTNKHAGRTANRFFKSMAISAGDPVGANAFAQAQPWIDEERVKAAVSALSTGSQSSLAADVGIDFVAAIYPKTIVGRLSNLRRVPLQTRLIRQTSGATAYWVGEGAPKPPAAAAFVDSGSLPERKVCAMSVVTVELTRSSDAEDIIGRDLQSAAIAAMDSAFIDPTNAGVADEKPASITNGLTPITGTTDPADDIGKAIAAFAGDLTNAAWVMHPETAAMLALRGAPFDKVHALGGELVGIPVLTSSAAPDDAITLLDQDGIELGGIEGAELRTAHEATIMMHTDPEAETAAPISLWQANAAGLLAEIIVNWRVARTGAVVIITGVDY